MESVLAKTMQTNLYGLGLLLAEFNHGKLIVKNFKKIKQYKTKYNPTKLIPKKLHISSNRHIYNEI